MVPMFVYRVGIDLMGHTFVLLADEPMERVLPIWIGQYEAYAIAAELDEKQFERPLTHDLLSSIIAALECHVEKVSVTKLEDKTFYGLVTLNKDGEPVHVDSRPSDAIALALKTGADIEVSEEVLAQAAVRPEEGGDEAEEIEKFRELLAEADISPDTFRTEDSETETENES